MTKDEGRMTKTATEPRRQNRKSKIEHVIGGGIEDMARLMKAEDGNIARARHFMESLREEAGGD
jgi:hypothetical protein